MLIACLASFPAGFPFAAEKQLPPPAQREIQFARDIQPLLEQSCVNCHGNGRSKGGFRLDNREVLLEGGDSGPAVKPGNSGDSLLIELVAGLDPDNVMPQKGTRLTDVQVGLLRAWVDQGVPWDSGVSFGRKARRNLLPVELPAGFSPEANPVDHLLAKQQAKSPAAAGLNASPQEWKAVNDTVFVRRVFLDTIGLLPSAQDVQDFREDPRPDKRDRLVNLLLGREEDYAEHWLSFWNDLLRNDYQGTGYIDGGRKQITQWLYSALSTNMPYDQFVASLVNPSPETAGFTKGIVWRGVVNASQTPEMQAAQNVSQVFMGVNLKCASCHDSFIDDWRLSDAYGLASVYSEQSLEMFQCDKPTGIQSKARFIYPELGEIDPALPRPERLKRLASIMTGPQNGRLSRTIVNRLWARFMGYGLVEPVDDMEQPAWNQELLDWLAEDLVRSGYDVKHTIRRILTSRAYQLPAVDAGERIAADTVFRGPAVRRLSAEQFRDALAQVTGIWYGKAAFSAKTNQVRAALVAADPLAVALGRPNREQVTTSRSGTATTLQALELTNGQTVARVIEQASARIVSDSGSGRSLVTRLYGSAFGRLPSSGELEVALGLLGEPASREGIADLLWAIAMLPEFQLIY